MAQGKPQNLALNRALARSMGVIFAANFQARGNRRDAVRNTLLTSTGSVTYTSGQFGNQVNLSGGAYLSRGAILTGGSYTIIARVKLNSLATAQMILVQGQASGTTRMNLSFQSGPQRFQFSPNGGNYAIADTAPVAGVWYHVAATYNEVGLIYHIFINGIRQTTTNVTAAVYTSNNTFRIGYSAFGDEPLNGSVAEAVVCNRLLTQRQILHHYQNNWALYRPQPQPLIENAMVPLYTPSPHLLFRRFM